jgi:hypothetical protein
MNMSDEDRELFKSAIADTPATEAPAPEPEPQRETQSEGDRLRDERGRFAPRTSDEPAPAPAPTPVEQPQQETEQPTHRDAIPPWRLREEAEARRAAEARAQQFEQEARQMRAYLEQQARQQQQQPAPDIFENPQAFVERGVRQAVDPVQNTVKQITEHYSKVMADQRFGEQTVATAYDAMGRALRDNDPDAHSAYQRMMASLDPYGEMVKWHKRSSVIQTIGDDPNAWFEKQLEERAKDPTFQAKLLERIRGNVSSPGRPASITQLPPSLNRVASSAPADGEEDMSDGALLKAALRR